MRPPAPAPPKGYRPHMPVKVKLEAVLIHGPVKDEQGNRVSDLKEIEFDHRPPLQARIWNEEAQDTDPPANDPNFIVPMAKALHRAKTAEKDISEIAKTKRLSSDHEEFRRKILSRQCGEKRKPTGKIRGRGFQKKRKSNG